MTAEAAGVWIASEWEDYKVAVHPQKEIADIVVQVDMQFTYRYLKCAT